MSRGPYNTNLLPCEQRMENCNRARKMNVLDEDGKEVCGLFCEILQDTHFNKPCPFYKDKRKA